MFIYSKISTTKKLKSTIKKVEIINNDIYYIYLYAIDKCNIHGILFMTY